MHLFLFVIVQEIIEKDFFLLHLHEHYVLDLTQQKSSMIKENLGIISCSIFKTDI